MSNIKIILSFLIFWTIIIAMVINALDNYSKIYYDCSNNIKIVAIKTDRCVSKDIDMERCFDNIKELLCEKKIIQPPSKKIIKSEKVK